MIISKYTLILKFLVILGESFSVRLYIPLPNMIYYSTQNQMELILSLLFLCVTINAFVVTM